MGPQTEGDFTWNQTEGAWEGTTNTGTPVWILPGPIMIYK
jgi:hypothetical protein